MKDSKIIPMGSFGLGNHHKMNLFPIDSRIKLLGKLVPRDLSRRLGDSLNGGMFSKGIPGVVQLCFQDTKAAWFHLKSPNTGEGPRDSKGIPPDFHGRKIQVLEL